MNNYEALNEKQKIQFKKSLNRLFSVGFINKKDKNVENDYYFIHSNLLAYKEFLNCFDYDIIIDEVNGVLQLINIKGDGKRSLKLYESIVILLLRILYDEKKRELSLTSQVMVTVEEINQKYLSLETREKNIDKTTLREALRTLKNIGIISILDKDTTKGDCRIIIYDSIALAIRINDIDEVSKIIYSYREKEVSDDEEISEDETDQLA